MRRKIVYINLHPDYVYSVAIIQGYLDICDYVRNVDWLAWDGRCQLSISGGFGDKEKAKERHIQRTKVFAQRMKDNGFTILVRNNRGEEWNDFIFDSISEEEMIEAELETDKEFNRLNKNKEEEIKRQEIIKSFWHEDDENDDFIEEIDECDELSEEMDEYFEAWLNTVRG